MKKKTDTEHQKGIFTFWAPLRDALKINRSYKTHKTEDNVSGESPHYKSEREERESEGFTDFTCETVITVDKDGIPVENGGENTQLKFIMAVAIAVLYGVL